MRLNADEISQVKFYQGFSKGFLKVTCFDYSKRKNNFDSFVKCSDNNFYNVKAIFSFRGSEFCLFEKIIVSNLHPEIHIENYSTELIHTFPIVNLESDDLIVKPIDYVVKQLSFIDISDSFRSNFDYPQYLIEVEN